MNIRTRGVQAAQKIGAKRVESRENIAKNLGESGSNHWSDVQIEIQRSSISVSVLNSFHPKHRLRDCNVATHFWI